MPLWHGHRFRNRLLKVNAVVGPGSLIPQIHREEGGGGQWTNSAPTRSAKP